MPQQAAQDGDSQAAQEKRAVRPGQGASLRPFEEQMKDEDSDRGRGSQQQDGRRGEADSLEAVLHLVAPQALFFPGQAKAAQGPVEQGEHG